MFSKLLNNECTMCLNHKYGDYCHTCLDDLSKNFSIEFDYNIQKFTDSLIYFGHYNQVAKDYLFAGKFDFQIDAFKSLGAFIASNLPSFPNKSLITYVPTDWVRFCLRGFNPSKVLASELSKNSGTKLKKIFKRIKKHKSLKNLNRDERIEELANSFGVISKKELLEAKQLYIIDDVYTTGATLNKLSAIAKEINPKIKVIGVCFVKTPLNYSDFSNIIQTSNVFL